VTVAASLAVAVGSIAILIGLMAVIWLLAPRLGWSPELKRKAMHIATGLYALSLPLIFHERWPVVVLSTLAVLVLLVLRLPVFARTGISSTLHDVHRKSYGEILLAVSVGVLFYRSLGEPVFYVLPIALVTLSDAAAALAGTSYGRRVFNVGDGRKSLEGVAVFFLVSWILAMVVLLLMTDIDRLTVVLLGLVVAAFGALVEADSWNGFDNLFVPVGVHLFLQGHIDSTPLTIAVIATSFILALVVVAGAAKHLRLARSSGLAYAILVFLILAVTDFHNSVIPLAAIFAALVAQRLRPAEDRYPDLDFVAVAAAIAFFWLVVGDASARNAINVYNLTFAAIGVTLMSIAGGRTLILGLAAAVVAGLLLLLVEEANLDLAKWYGTLWPWAAASLALAVLVPALMPSLFDRHRSFRVGLLSLPIPIILFASRGFA
jgi:dolichol kinase